MARKRKKGKRRVRGVSGKFQKRRAKKGRGQIPLTVLKRRLSRLDDIVKRRQGGPLRGMMGG